MAGSAPRLAPLAAMDLLGSESAPENAGKQGGTAVMFLSPLRLDGLGGF